MKGANAKNNVKFPEQLKIKGKLTSEDKKKVAKYSGYKYGTLREMLNGYRKMTDKVKEAIIKVYEEKSKLNSAIDQIVNQ